MREGRSAAYVAVVSIAAPSTGGATGWLNRSSTAFCGKVASVKAAFTVEACTSPDNALKACGAFAMVCAETALKTVPEPSACTAFATAISFGVTAAFAKVPGGGR